MAEIETDAADFFSVFRVESVGQCDELLKTGRDIPKDRRIFIPGLADTVLQRDSHTELRTQLHIGSEIRPIPFPGSHRQIAAVFIHHRSRMNHIIGHAAFRRQNQTGFHRLVPFFSVGFTEIEGVKHRPVGEASGHAVREKPLRETVNVKIRRQQSLYFRKAQIHTGNPGLLHQIQKGKIIFNVIPGPQTAGHHRITHDISSSFLREPTEEKRSVPQHCQKRHEHRSLLSPLSIPSRKKPPEYGERRLPEPLPCPQRCR